MATKQILSLTLLTTALMLNASTPIEIRVTTRQQSTSLSTTIANILFKRGLEKETAFKIAKKVIGENETLFSMMLQNYIKTTASNQDAVLKLLTQYALTNTKTDFTSYSFLIKLTQSLHSTRLNKEMLSKLDKISTNNSLFKGLIA